ncbi:MAG: MoxR family ATPase [Planctomycetes bacterium]|nr:MoxR family ATPase [Planctomycetota bacterium]
MTLTKSSSNPEEIELTEKLQHSFSQIRTQIANVIVGQDKTIEQLLIAILAGGHCLLEGVPGLAKTLMVRSLARAMDLQFQRIQFTPDLMPADITGTDIIQQSVSGHRELVFQKGPVFTQILLADEINRTPPKTQAALLEAMQEHSVTVGGKHYSLSEPFFVLATQNPIEQEGTYPLPEAQRDRFLFQTIVDYPTREQESDILERTTGTQDGTILPVVTGPEIVAFQRVVRLVPLTEHIKQLVLSIVRALRPLDEDAPKWVTECVQWGPGPRASQQLVIAGKSRALLHGRLHVITEDIEALAAPVLRHRILPTFSAQADGVRSDDIISRIIKETIRR